MSLRAREIDRAWNKVGLEIHEGARHTKAVLRIRGKVYLRTMRSRGGGPLKGLQPALIRQQMKLSEDQFAGLLGCPLDRDGYLRILANLGLVPPEAVKDGPP